MHDASCCAVRACKYRRVAAARASKAKRKARDIKNQIWGHSCFYAKAVAAVAKDLQEAHLDMHVPVPAINRWIKLFMPLPYWNVGVRLRYLPKAFEVLARFVEKKEAAPLVLADLIGIGTDETWQQKRRARFKKSTAWLNNPLTSLRLTTATTCLLPVVTLMSRLFLDARFTSAGHSSMMQFSAVSSPSPASVACSRYFDMLRDPELDVWLPIRGIGDWSEDRVKCASVVSITIVAGLWFRTILPFTLWPWRLGRAVDPHASLEARRETSAEFFKCKAECCTDPGFGRHVRRAMQEPHDLTTKAELILLVRGTLSKCPADNIANEDRFARQTASHHGCQGNVPGHATVAARHTLSEHQAWHSIAMDLCSEQQRLAQVLQRDVSSDVAQRFPKIKNGFVAYVAAHRAEANVSALSARWREMPDHDKLPYIRQYEESKERANAAAGDHPQPEPRAEALDISTAAESTPFKMGSEKYPASEEKVAQFTQDLTKAGNEWLDYVGRDLVGEAGVELKDITMTQCCDLYGLGTCAEDLTPQQRDSVKQLKRFLWAVARSKPSATRAGGVEDLFLVIFQPQVEADAQGPPLSARCFLLTLTLWNPVKQVFWEIKPQDDNVAPGCVLDVTLSLGALCDEVRLAMWMLRDAPRVKVSTASYRWATLSSIVLDSIEDITDNVLDLVRGKKLDDELALIKDLSSKLKKASGGSAARSTGNAGTGLARAPADRPAPGPGAQAGATLTRYFCILLFT